jgi:hypothetical protein
VVVWTNSAAAERDWLSAAAQRTDLPAAAVCDLARRLGRDETEFLAAWRAKTPAEVDCFWEAAPLDANRCYRSLTRLAAGEIACPPNDLAAALTSTGESSACVPVVADLLPGHSLPALLFSPPTAQVADAWPASVGADAVRWVVRTPRCPTAIVVPADCWARYLAEAPDSRIKALLREGEAVITVVDPATAARELEVAGMPPDVAATTTRVLEAGGPTESLLRSAVEAARATAGVDSPETDAAARSAAERMLFELLESIPDTAGRFELNGRLDFRFGPRLAEIDLLAREERIAVEIDGYFHFRDADGYRRDRSKDWELQRHGYLVLRFLADDVVRQVEQVRDRILAAFARPHSEGPP